MDNKFMLKRVGGLIIIISILLSSSILYAEQNEHRGMPPANVVVSEVRTGMIAPEAEFIGTVYFQEVSDVASEVSGKVVEVSFEEGQMVDTGTILVRLGSDLLNKTLQATQASYEQVLTDLEKEEINLKRVNDLYINELISEKSYDEQRFTVHSLKKNPHH